MPKAYLIGMIWADQSEFAAYHEKSAALLDRHGGRYLVVGGDPSVAQGEEAPRSVVVLEFPNREAAKAFYNDADYAALRIMVPQSHADRHLVLVSGLD